MSAIAGGQVAIAVARDEILRSRGVVVSRPRRRSRRAIGRLFRHRALDAAAKSLICFALLHQIVLAADSVARRDASAWNVFTMIEAQRLAPILGAGPASQWASAAFALVVYGLVFGFLTRPRRPALVRHRLERSTLRSVVTERPGVANGNGHLGGNLAPHALRPGVALACGVAAAGVAVHMACLALVERFVDVYPSVPDVIQSRLPYVDFGVPGELFFLGFVAVLVAVLLRKQIRSVPSVLILLGVFYAMRGVFLFLLPIGSPPTAPALADRFVLYPYAGHAYFPGGHTGMMTICSLAIHDRRWRRALLALTVVFALGTIVSRTHYTADALGGWLLGYAIMSWGRRHLAPLAPVPMPVAVADARVGRSESWNGRPAIAARERVR